MKRHKIDSFLDELEKIAEEIDWKAFERDLRKKSFQNSVLKDPNSDAKLRKYVRNVGGYLTSKDVVAKVPSRSSSKVYKIKRLPSGRLACGCRDWQYNHSVKNTDCVHIKGLEKKKQAEAIEMIAKGMNFARLATRHRKKKVKKNGKASSGF